ncbi:MAG: SpoIIE family protein phosphatase [Armatimonadetes bacterium]|nr:SpoIIE family protein phosphatase [Armatimonadota bacterium]
MGYKERRRMADCRTRAVEEYGGSPERSPLAFAATEGPQHVLRYVNPAFCRLFGREREALLHRPFAEALPESRQDGSLALLDRVYRTGEAECAVDLERPRTERGAAYWSYAVWPVQDGPYGQGLVIQVTDTTEAVLARRRYQQAAAEIREINERLVIASLRQQELAAQAQAAQRRAAFLAQAGRLLATSLEYEVILQNVARLAVPEIADWCAVDALEEDGSVRRRAVAHADPAKERLVWRLERRYPPDTSRSHQPIVQTLRTGQPQLLPEVTDALLVATALDTDQLQTLRALGLRSAMFAPLVSRGRRLGVIVFGLAESGRRYGPDDLALAEELARDVALAVDNARLYRTQKQIAHMLQQSLLLARLPEIPGLEVAARYLPAAEGAEVGGDFYDLFQTGKGTWEVVIGDVSGKGVAAAAVTALARYTLRAVSMYERQPSRVLARLNEALLRQQANPGYCAVAYASLNFSSSPRVTVACAGHPLPLLLRRDGSVSTIGQPGTLLGAFPELVLAEESVDLGAGDTVVLYTDGVSEARMGADLFGEERLASLVASCAGLDAGQIAVRIESAVVEFQDGHLRDDIALVVIRVSGALPPKRPRQGTPSRL